MITNSSFISFQLEEVQKGRDAFVDNLKIIIYSAFSEVFDFVDFENDEAFQEPLLYAFFNSDKKENIDILKCILLGYSNPEKRKTISIDFYNVPTDQDVLYFPNLGFFYTADFCPQGKLSAAEFITKATPFIKALPVTQKLKIPVIPVQLNLLAPYYYDANSTQLKVDVSEAYKKKFTHFDQACTDINNQLEWFSKLINIAVKNTVLFDDYTDPHEHLHCKRNSFASLSVNGVSFHNCYQPWYGKVFFYDDIAHQMGHVIFYYIIQDKESYFKIDPDSTFKSITTRGQEIDAVETRSQEIVFHALYTYYTTLVVLDTMYKNEILSDIQKQEVLGRIGFYVNKSYRDLSSYDKIGEKKNIKNIFTEKGEYVFSQFIATFRYCYKEYYSITKKFDYSNQSYNFNLDRFKQANKLEVKNSYK